jgi:adenine-specific DNA-methyltransferase
MDNGQRGSIDRMAAYSQLFDPRATCESEAYLTSQIVTYIGNKRGLLSLIGKGVDVARDALRKEKITFLDLFAGSGIVSRYVKQFSSLVIANDLENYSYLLNRCYLSNVTEIPRAKLLPAFHAVKSGLQSGLHPGFITELYAPGDDNFIQRGERVFYTRRNAMYIDTARQLMAELPLEIQHLLIAPLLAAASVHANTSGVFKGFYKNKQGVGQYGGDAEDALSRIKREIELDLPVLSNFTCNYEVHQEDANLLVRNLPEVDVAYFDPPYNQHPYGSNYFMLNLIASYRRPGKISSVSGIPEGWLRSEYNKRPKAEAALFDAVDHCKARFILISYNSEGFVTRESFLHELESRGQVSVFDTRYNTFRGCRNLRDREIAVTESLYLVDRKASHAVKRAASNLRSIRPCADKKGSQR